MFAARTRWELSPNRLSVELENRRRSGLPVLDLTESNATVCGFEYPADDLLGSWTGPENLVYQPSPKGHLKAREAIAGYYAEKGIEVSPEQIVLTASTSEAYTFLFRLLTDPGDAVLAPRPSYPLFDFLSTLNDIDLDFYRLNYEGRWRIDGKALPEGKAERLRALLVVNPNNPTGSFLNPCERSELLGYCQERQLALISDEVFADYEFTAAADRVISLAGTSQVLTFALGGISKLLGLPQMKLAWICASGPPAELKEALARLEIIADTYLSVNTPVQLALPRWMGLRSHLTEQIRARVLQNWRHLQDRLASESSCERLEADGGWYAILHASAMNNEERFVLELLAGEGVLVHPGYFFDFETEGILVVSLLPRVEVFREGIDRVLRRRFGVAIAVHDASAAADLPPHSK